MEDKQLISAIGQMLDEKLKEVLIPVSDRLDRLEDRMVKIELTQENIITPKLDLLLEGQKTTAISIKRVSAIDALQDDVSTLKTAVRYLSQELDALKKAE